MLKQVVWPVAVLRRRRDGKTRSHFTKRAKNACRSSRARPQLVAGRSVEPFDEAGLFQRREVPVRCGGRQAQRLPYRRQRDRLPCRAEQREDVEQEADRGVRDRHGQEAPKWTSVGTR